MGDKEYPTPVVGRIEREVWTTGDPMPRHFVAPSYKPPRKPIYCEKCGDLLDEVNAREVKYDRYTGIQYTLGPVTLRCRNYKVEGDAESENNGHDSIEWDDSPKPTTTVIYRHPIAGM